MKVFAFDIDHTLEISQGPVTFASIVELRNQSHIVGLCGNFAVVTMNINGWHTLFSFIGPHGIPKEYFLASIKQYCPAEEYVMIGNIFGVTGASDDQGAAERANWRFILEADFANGQR